MASENILTNTGNLPFLIKKRAIFHQDCNEILYVNHLSVQLKNSLCFKSYSVCLQTNN